MIVANTHLFKIRTPNMKAQTIILSIASIAIVTIIYMTMQKQPFHATNSPQASLLNRVSYSLLFLTIALHLTVWL